METLFRRHAPGVLRLARAMTREPQTAEDVAQETFLLAFRGAGSYRPELAPVRTWLFAIARNAARKSHRKPTAPTGPVSERTLAELGAAAGWGANDPERELDRAERVELLARAIASLPPADAEVVVLRDLEGMSGEDAARLLGVEVGALKSRLHRARLRLLESVRAGERGVSASEREAGGLRCGEVLARLGDYVDGELAEEERARVDLHLRGCTVCERFGGRFAGIVGEVRANLGAPAALDEALLERIRAWQRG